MRVTRTPLNAPSTAPSATAASIAGQIGQPCLKSSAIATPLSPSVDATERSISPVTTMSVSGSAMIATSPTLRQMKNRLVGWRKYGDTSAPKAIVPPSTTRRSASQRASGPRTRHLATRPPPCAQGRRDPDRDQAVERDRREEQRARERLAPEGREVDDDARAVDRVEEERAQGGAEHRAAAAEDRDAADDHRRDHLELVAHPGDGVDRPVVRQPDGAREPGDAAAQDEREEHAALDGDAREAGGVRVRADGVEVARGAERAHRIGRDRDRDDRDDREVGNVRDRAVADPVEAGRQHRGVHLVASRPGAVDPADDVQGPERDDEARDPRDRHDEPVQDAAGEPDADGREEDRDDRDVRVVAVEDARRVGGDTEHRADREIDVARDDDDRLADREQGDDRRAREDLLNARDA